MGKSNINKIMKEHEKEVKSIKVLNLLYKDYKKYFSPIYPKEVIISTIATIYLIGKDIELARLYKDLDKFLKKEWGKLHGK